MSLPAAVCDSSVNEATSCCPKKKLRIQTHEAASALCFLCFIFTFMLLIASSIATFWGSTASISETIASFSIDLS